MAEAVVVVCDSCGAPAAETVSIKVGGRALQKDLCSRHLKELVSNARPARRGRPRGKATASRSTSGTKRSGKSGASRTRKKTRKRAA